MYVELSKKDLNRLIELVTPLDKELAEKIKKESWPFELDFKDIQTGDEWLIDFIFVAFPGLKHSGYRVEGVNKKTGNRVDLGTLIISDGELKIIQW